MDIDRESWSSATFNWTLGMTQETRKFQLKSSYEFFYVLFLENNTDAASVVVLER